MHADRRSGATVPSPDHDDVVVVDVDDGDGDATAHAGLLQACAKRRFRVVVASPATMVAEGLATLLDDGEQFSVRPVVSLAEIEHVAADGPVHVVVLAPEFADHEASVVAELKRLLPSARVLLLTEGLEAARGLRLLRQGAHGYLPQTADAELARHAIAAVASGAAVVGDLLLAAAVRWFSELFAPRFQGLEEEQLELWRAIARDDSLADIAAAQFYSERTARRNIADLLDTLGVESRVQAAELAGRLHLLDGHEPGATEPPAEC